MFVGERFESDQDFKQAKSMLLDMFRGQQVGGVDSMQLGAGMQQHCSLR